MAAVTLAWLVALPVVMSWMRSAFITLWGSVLLLMAAGVLGAVAPRLHRVAPTLSDWDRWWRRRAAARRHCQGYEVAKELGIIAAIDPKKEPDALRRAGKYLPEASYLSGPATGVLDVVQTVAATDEVVEKKARAVAPVLGFPAEFVEVSRPTPRTVRVVWRAAAPADSLAEPVAWVPDAAPGPVDAPVLIGRTATGEFRLNLWDCQTLVLGASGSGKGSVVWSVMLGLAPQIKAGTVRVTGLDLKGGVEILSGVALFNSVAMTFEEAAESIKALRDEVDRRLAHMVSVGSRKHVPTAEEPAMILVVDEYASLVYSAPDNKAKAAVEQDLKRILSTGRAARINALALAQDPRAESILARPLFTQVVALRFRTADDAALALGPSAVAAGATAHLTPQSQPGTGFAIDEDGSVQRFRAFWCTDEVIRDVSAAYGRRGGVQVQEMGDNA